MVGDRRGVGLRHDLHIELPARKIAPFDGFEQISLTTGDDPFDALTVRLAAAYEEPWPLKFHFDDVGSASGSTPSLTSFSQYSLRC